MVSVRDILLSRFWTNRFDMIKRYPLCWILLSFASIWIVEAVEDTCSATANYKCLETLTHNAFDIVGDVKTFQTTCSGLATQKACIAETETDKCSAVQMERMTSYVTLMESRIFAVCEDKYKTILTVNIPKVVIPSTCDPTWSESLLDDFFDLKYKTLLASDGTGKLTQASCTKLATEVKRITDSMETCPDLTKSQMAQALHYPRGLAEGSCTDVKWPTWPLLTWEDPSKQDTCLQTENFKCLEKLTNNALDIAGDVPKFQTACSTLSQQKTCITAKTDKCTSVQMGRMTSYVTLMESRILVVCADKYKTVLSVDIPLVDNPSTCDPEWSEGLIEDFFKTEYANLMALSGNGKLSTAACTKLATEVKRITDSMETCPDLTKSQMAQALHYPRGLAEGSCTDVKWPTWPLLTTVDTKPTDAATDKPKPATTEEPKTEVPKPSDAPKPVEEDTCMASDHFKMLDRYVKDTTSILTEISADATSLCSKYSADLQAISSTETKGCDTKQQDVMRKIASHIVAALKAKCSDVTVSVTDPAMCKPHGAAEDMVKAIETLTHTLVEGESTDELCLIYVNGIIAAKNHMYHCTVPSNTGLEDTIKYLNSILVPIYCPNYIDVPWPTNRSPEFEQEITIGPAPYPGVTTEEGQPSTSEGNIVVKWATDPSTVCKGQPDCSVVVEIGLPKCKSAASGLDGDVPQVGIMWPVGSSNPSCGIPVTSSNWQSQTFPLVATLDMMYDPDRTCHAVISYKKKVHGKTESSGEISRVHLAVKNMDKKAVCMYVGNMLTTTFDGHFYNNFLTGFFTAYKHKTLPYQVQIAVTECEPKTTCICAVAVQSGDDVFVMDRCPRKDSTWPSGTCEPGECLKPTEPPLLRTKLFKNGKLTPMTRIYNRQGQDYKIVLPTTGTVDVFITTSAMNVLINPSPKDFSNTEGLCGLFDSNAENDFLREDGTAYQPSDFMEQQRIASDKASIFYGVSPQPSVENSFCQCLMEPGKPVTPKCSQSSGEFSGINWDKSFRDITDVVMWTAEEPNLTKPEHGTRAIATVNPVEPFITVSKTPPPASLVLPKGKWTKEEDITKFCDDMVNDKTKYYSDVLSKCNDVPGASKTSIKNSCLYGIKRSGDKSFVQDSIVAAIENCRSNIIKEPPTKDNPGKIPDYPKTCPTNCNGNGKCESGVCSCNQGFENNDCTVKTTDGPKFMGVEPNPSCDMSKRNCSAIIVAGEHFRDKPVCVFEEIKVFSDKPFERSGTVKTLPAAYDNNNQIYCLGNDPPKPGIYHPIPKEPTGSWSDPAPVYMPFDSVCFDCDIKAVTCTPRKSACFVNGKCYASGAGVMTNGACQICDPGVATDRLIIAAKECATVAPVPPDAHQLCDEHDEKSCDPVAAAVGSAKETKEIGPMWWILLVLLILLLLCVVILCCILCCFCGQNKGERTYHQRREIFQNEKMTSLFAGIAAGGKPAACGVYNGAFVHEDETDMPKEHHISTTGYNGQLQILSPHEGAVVTDHHETVVLGHHGVSMVDDDRETVELDEGYATCRMDSTVVVGLDEPAVLALHVDPITTAHHDDTTLVAKLREPVIEGHHTISSAVEGFFKTGAAILSEEANLSIGSGCARTPLPQPYNGLLVHEPIEATTTKHKSKLLNFFGQGFGHSNTHLQPGDPVRRSLRIELPRSLDDGQINEGECHTIVEERGSPCLTVGDSFDYNNFGQNLTEVEGDNSYMAFTNAFPNDSPGIDHHHCHTKPEGELISEMVFGSEFGSRSGSPLEHVQSVAGEFCNSGNKVSTLRIDGIRNNEQNVHERSISVSRGPTPTFGSTAQSNTRKLDSPTPPPKMLYTDGGASDSTFDSSAHHATSIYEANIDTELEVDECQDPNSIKKPFRGALVQGKFINKGIDEALLYDDFDRPNDMNINPLFFDDGVQHGYAYMSTSQANPQSDVRHAQGLPSNYMTNASFYTAPISAEANTRPLETVFIDAKPHTISTESPVFVRTADAPIVQTESAFVVQDQGDTIILEGRSSPQASTTDSNLLSPGRPEIPELVACPVEPVQRGSIPNSAALNEEFYFVDSKSLEAIDIRNDSIEGCEVRISGTLAGAETSETET